MRAEPAVADVEVGGARVRYRVAGEGPPLVLVHGLSGSWRWWTPVLGALAGRFRTHLVDVPRFATLAGFGPGDAADWLGRFFDAAGIERAPVVGHSLGGLLAAQLGARRPDAVERLALVDPAGVPSGRGLLGHALPLAAALRAARPELLSVVVRDGVRTGPASLLRGALYAVGADLRPELEAIEAPTLLVWGEDDGLVPARLAEEWERRLRDVRLVRLAGAGHVPMFDAPAELARVLLDFLEEGAHERRGRPGR